MSLSVIASMCGEPIFNFHQSTTERFVGNVLAEASIELRVLTAAGTANDFIQCCSVFGRSHRNRHLWSSPSVYASDIAAGKTPPVNRATVACSE